MICNISIDELDKKIEAQMLLHSYVTNERFEELKDQLVRYADTRFHSLRDLINYENHPNLCGCLGPRYGFTICPCAMSSELDNYRFHLAKYIKLNQENQ